MRLRDIIDSPCGIRYMLEELPLSCSFSYTYLLNTELASAAGTVERIYVSEGQQVKAGEMVAKLK